MADVKVEQKQSLSRQDAARFIAALAKGLADDGRVSVQLGSSTLELSVAGQVDCELEVAVDGDEIELEMELKWSISGRSLAEAAQDKLQAGELDTKEADEDESEGDDFEGDDFEGDEPEEDALERPPPMQDAATGAGAAEDDAAAEDTSSPSGAEPVQPAAPDRSAQPRRTRRTAAAGSRKPASNGVDTAAVRAWAAANGVSVSPRSRIKHEVLQAYRAARN